MAALQKTERLLDLSQRLSCSVVFFVCLPQFLLLLRLLQTFVLGQTWFLLHMKNVPTQDGLFKTSVIFVAEEETSKREECADEFLNQD